LLPPTATGWNIYIGLSGQPLNQQYSSPSIPCLINSSGNPGTPPVKNTAFYPDSDGNFVSAYTIYRWLNEALEMASMITEGIPDTSGVQAIAGQGQYILPGNWKKLFHIWYNGFPVAWAGSQDMFYRNKLEGISFLALVQQNADKMVFELQPQCDRTGGSTVLLSPVAPTDTVINIVSGATFYLCLGLAQIGSEIIAYSNINGTTLTGCSRGMGGTVPSSWPAGTIVNECNIRINGQRVFNSPEFFPGMSSATLSVPPGWKRPLVDYMLSKVREGEQSAADMEKKLAQFTSMIKSAVKGNELVSGPRQVGGTMNPNDAYPTSGGFGIFVR
jgi:hypothetical protein